MQAEQLKIKNPKMPLANNMAGAICLTFVQIFSYFCICVIGATSSIFLTALKTLLKNESVLSTLSAFSLSDIVGITVTLSLSLLLLSPLRLSVKGFYRRLNNDFTPLTYAFSSFTSFKRYRASLWFCFVRAILIFLLFFLPMLPPILLISLLRGAFLAIGKLNVAALVVIVSAVILFLLALIFSCYHAIDFFYVDYLFLSGKVKNPFVSFKLSKKLAKANKLKLLKALLGAFPYMLLCLLIFPAFFAIPKIQSDFARHASATMSATMSTISI